MSALKKALIDTVGALRARLHGGRQFGGFRQHSIAVQTFNANAKGPQKGHGDTVMLFLPGFTAIPNIVSPDPLRKWAHEQGWDFARFYHPYLATDQSRLRYTKMILEASNVALNLPQRRVVLAGSSFGAGMMPYVAELVNDEQTGRVVGMFGWMAATPKALRDRIIMTAGYTQFAQGAGDSLPVELGVAGKFFNVSRPQLDDLMAQKVPPRFEGAAVFIAGTQDTIGRPCYTHDILGMCEPTRRAYTELPTDHRFPREHIAPHLAKLKVMLG
jgi:hypothetical protein